MKAIKIIGLVLGVLVAIEHCFMPMHRIVLTNDCQVV
jgi:hypothetical protein